MSYSTIASDVLFPKSWPTVPVLQPSPRQGPLELGIGDPYHETMDGEARRRYEQRVRALEAFGHRGSASTNGENKWAEGERS